MWSDVQNDNKGYDYLQMSNMKEVKNTVYHPQFGYGFHPSRINEAVDIINTEARTQNPELSKSRGPMSTPAGRVGVGSNGQPRKWDIKKTRARHVRKEPKKEIKKNPEPKIKKTKANDVRIYKQLLEIETDTELKAEIQKRIKTINAARKGRAWALLALKQTDIKIKEINSC